MLQERKPGWSLQSSWPRRVVPTAAAAVSLILLLLTSNTLSFSTSSSALTSPATEKLLRTQADKLSSCEGFGDEACQLPSRYSHIFDNNNDDDDDHWYCLNSTTTAVMTTVTETEPNPNPNPNPSTCKLLHANPQNLSLQMQTRAQT